MTPALLTASQVGDLLDVDTSTIYRMAGDGRLPAVRVGRQWRFSAERIADAIQAGVPFAAANGAPVPPSPSPLSADVAATVVGLVAESLGVMMVVTDMQGQPLTPVLNPCPWFRAHAEDAAVAAECVEEWRDLAHDLDLAPHFRTGRHGFLCARVFVRAGTELVAMVLAGGLAPDGVDDDGLYHLDAAARDHALHVLSRVGTDLSHLAGHPRATSDAPFRLPEMATPALR